MMGHLGNLEGPIARRYPNLLRASGTHRRCDVKLATVPEIAEKILTVFREKTKSKGSAEVSATELYHMFQGVSHDMIQAAVRYLSDRDFIAPHSYSLTAKGMVKQVRPDEWKIE